MKFKVAKEKANLYMIMIAGALLRLFYVCLSTIYERQYDIGQIDLDAGHTVSGGHLAYIQYFFHNGMPDFDPTSVYQFHHPPLHHAICAGWMKFCSLFIKNTEVVEEAIQVVPFVCSLLTLWLLYRIVDRFEIGEKVKCFVVAIFAFHPALVLLSGSVNNDCMALLFTVWIVDLTMEWSKKPSFVTIVKLAFAISLGMLVKQNVAEMAFPVAAVFLYVFIKNFKEKAQRNNLFGQFTVFGIISLPIGMSFYIRNLVKFHMSMFWVYEISEDSWQYTGNVPVLNRFLWPVPSDIIENLTQFKLGCGYNVWMQIVRTSVLGEWDMAAATKPVKLLAVLLMFLGAILAFAALCAFIKVFIIDGIKNRKNIDVAVYLLFAIGYLVNMFCYLTFAYNYPQECSMNFRYITINLLFPAVALGMALHKSKKKWTWVASVGTLVAFALCSVAMIAYWGIA